MSHFSVLYFPELNDTKRYFVRERFTTRKEAQEYIKAQIQLEVLELIEDKGFVNDEISDETDLKNVQEILDFYEKEKLLWEIDEFGNQ